MAQLEAEKKHLEAKMAVLEVSVTPQSLTISRQAQNTVSIRHTARTNTICIRTGKRATAGMEEGVMSSLGEDIRR